MDLLITLLLSTLVQFLLFVYLRGRIEQQLNATDLLKNVQTEIDAMVRELNLSAERNIGVLESRIAEMEVLLGKADQRAIVLQRELERRDRASEVYSQMRRALAEPPVETPSVTLGPDALAPSPEVSDIAPQPVLSQPAPPKPLKQRVVDLRLEGKSPREIASLTGATQGEVELILSIQQDLFGSAT
jgi:hypothetical protein